MARTIMLPPLCSVVYRFQLTSTKSNNVYEFIRPMISFFSRFALNRYIVNMAVWTGVTNIWSGHQRLIMQRVHIILSLLLVVGFLLPTVVVKSPYRQSDCLIAILLLLLTICWLYGLEIWLLTVQVLNTWHSETQHVQFRDRVAIRSIFMAIFRALVLLSLQVRPWFLSIDLVMTASVTRVLLRTCNQIWTYYNFSLLNIHTPRK